MWSAAGYFSRATYSKHRDVVTVVSHAATIAAGVEWIAASDEWVNERAAVQGAVSVHVVPRHPPNDLLSEIIRGVVLSGLPTEK